MCCLVGPDVFSSRVVKQLVTSKDVTSGFEDAIAYMSTQNHPTTGPAVTTGTKVTLVGATSTGVSCQGTVQASKDVGGEFNFVHHTQGRN